VKSERRGGAGAVLAGEPRAGFGGPFEEGGGPYCAGGGEDRWDVIYESFKLQSVFAFKWR